MNDKMLVERVIAWLDGGCSSWNVPSSDIRQMATRIEALEAALRETMSRCTDCGGRGSFVKHDEVTDRDLWESCASCAVGYAALESNMTDQVTVTQEDRLLLADLADLPQSDAMSLYSGAADKDPKIMRRLQLVARHRIAAEQRGMERAAGIAEADEAGDWTDGVPRGGIIAEKIRQGEQG